MLYSFLFQLPIFWRANGALSYATCKEGWNRREEGMIYYRTKISKKVKIMGNKSGVSFILNYISPVE